MDFRVDQIDHVELVVPDRYVAAEWYQNVLGLRIVKEFEHWAEDPRGPLMISTQLGNTKLALFEGKPSSSRQGAGFHLVAFRVGAESFLQFVKRLSQIDLVDEIGHPVTHASVTDHGAAMSIYFCDPQGYQLELTTYESDEVKKRLGLNH